MAIPLIPLALASLAIGTGLQLRAQDKRQDAMRRAFDAFARRSDQRSAEARQLFERSLGEQDINVQQQRIEDAAAAKRERVAELIDDAGYIDPMLPGQSRAPQVIRSQAAKSLADELARARAQIAALAQLEGFSTRTFDRGLELERVRPQLANLGIFAQGDRNIFEADTLAAQNRGSREGLLGDVLTGIGSLMLMHGAGVGKGADKDASKIISSTSGRLDYVRPLSRVT